MKISGIYQIQSKIKPERIYIGSAININQRWNRHLYTLKSGIHRNIKLQRHFNRYGEIDLQFSILLGCEKEYLIANEQFFIDSYNPYFNININASSRLGSILSEETRKKISQSLIGKHHSEETKEKLSKSHKGLNTWLKGKKLSKSHCKKVSESLLGNKRSVGRVLSDETKRKISKAQIGKPKKRRAS